MQDLIRFKHIFKWLGAGTLIATVIAPSFAVAQTIQQPPRRDAKSATGVSFRNGSFSFEDEDLTLGGGTPTGLSLSRSYNSATNGLSDPYIAAAGWTHSLNIYVSSSPLPQDPEDTPPPNYRGRCVYNVTGGSKSAGFINYAPVTVGQTACGGAITGPYVPITPNGAKLEYITTSSPNFYRYTEADGTIINFTASSGRAANLTRPDGTRLDFTYVSGSLKSVFSNRGWAILFESATKACAVNTARTFVTATAGCPATAQTVTYSYTPGTYTSSWQLMRTATKAGDTQSYDYAANDHINCIKDPGQTTCRIQNTYAACPADPQKPLPQPEYRLNDYVTSQTDGSGRSYTYSYLVWGQSNLCKNFPWMTDPDQRPFSPMTTTMTETGITGTTLAVTDTASQVTSVTDPLARTSGFGYIASAEYLYESGDLTSLVMPEGNSETFALDARGNITARTVIAKPGSGLPSLVTTAVYPSTCANFKTCNKPTSVTDPKLNTTDYTYDSTHGGVLSETLPADANGIRAVKRYAYVQRSAWLANSGNTTWTQSANPVWLLDTVKSCRATATTISGTCAGGTADEVTTAYDYGPNSGPNNLLLRGEAVTADGVTLRTCYGYNRDGWRISETKPRAGLASCP